MKKKLALAVAVCAPLIMANEGCEDATVANHNITKAADNFEIMRRVTMVNGITNDFIMTVEGFCSYEVKPDQFYILCRDSEALGGYRKHTLVRSDNVFAAIEQMEAVDVSVNHYRYTWKPQVILPDIDIRGDALEAVTPRSQ